MTFCDWLTLAIWLFKLFDGCDDGEFGKVLAGRTVPVPATIPWRLVSQLSMNDDAPLALFSGLLPVAGLAVITELAGLRVGVGLTVAQRCLISVST